MKIVVYDDNPDFGGHQVMACHGIEALDSEAEVVRITSPQALEKEILTRPPDRVLCVQGDLRQSTPGIRAARRAGIECVSYLALPHALAAMGAKLGTLRDLRPIPRPDRYIVISESMKQLLLERGAKQPITIVPNGIPTPVRTAGVPPAHGLTLGLFGRIEFSQKRQDFMVRTFLRHPEAFEKCRLLIAGNGPDEEKLKQMISGKENITLLPWPNDPETLYKQIDILVIPSRYEGVPLVMLEALARGIPVMGSARDGMKDLLPEAWTFEPGNAAALIDAWKSKKDGIAALQKKVLNEYSLKTFQNNFCNAVLN